MGLDVSHDAWCGAYSAFSRWREKLAVAAGYDVVKLSVEQDMGRMVVCVDYGLWPEAGYYDPPYIPCRVDGSRDPLLLLIMHSDCEGSIRAGFLPALADRLEELAPLVAGEDGGGHVGDYGAKTLAFAAGARAAAAAGEDLRFF